MSKRLEVSEEEARAIRRALLLLDRKEGRLPPSADAVARLAAKKYALRHRGDTAAGEGTTA